MRAARASSTRRTGVVCGADRACSTVGVLGDPLERLGQRLERLEALGLGRLDHERLVHDEREVDRRGVEALLEQPLGHVEGLDPRSLLQRRAPRHHLVHAGPVVGDVVAPSQPAAEPVGVEHGHARPPAAAVAAVHEM